MLSVNMHIEPMLLSISLKAAPAPQLCVEEPEILSIGLGIIQVAEIGGEGTELFAGPYDCEPGFEPQILATERRTMKSDVTVNAIRVSRTTNQSGGRTIYIGGIIDE